MYLKLSVIAALATFATAAPSTTTTAAGAPAAPSSSPSVPASLIPLPAFSGTLVGVYPPQDKTAPTDTPLVKQWLQELNLTAIPTWPVVPFTAAGDPQNPTAIPAASCDWTETNCINKDLTTCPLGVWGLTYDDGPTEFSGKLYDFLDTTDQKATLFYIGSNVIQNPALARRACGAGHHIAVHTWSHNPSTSLTNEQFVAEVKYTEMAIKELCGFTPTYFRPPYGDIDDRIRSLLWAMGYTSTGHMTLEHELYQNTVDAAIANLPKVQATWKTMPVSACMNDAHPYKEKNITLATMDGAKTGVTNNSTTSSTAAASASSTASAGSSTASGSVSHSTTGSGAVVNVAVSSVAVLAVAAVTLGQMMLL
ncbi:chitin deacetylase [Linnemannia gamsii]|uniref:Chitin deacetylase n=1 Tax=Linnemannia gamsii TaxID=64522 RepID=A0ABQ7JVH5_9FUNG|nr:chitin deacetylase [Linnemannia gamsii]